MGSNNAVDVYQADSKKCCCAKSCVENSAVDPALVCLVGSNFLLSVQKCKTSKIVLARRFRLWCCNTKSVLLNFNFQPPIVFLSSDLPHTDETQTVPSQNGDLLEFAPIYSGKSYLQFQLKRESYGESEVDKGDDAKRSSYLQVPYCNDNGLCTQSKHHLTATFVSDRCGENKNKLLQEVDNPLSKSHWCASPHISGKNRKKKDLVLQNVKETNLEQVRKKYGVSYNQRGKWIISKRVGSLKEKNLGTVEEVWKKICLLIREGHLPHCNGKFQKAQQQVWVYCDFKHSLKVRSTLEHNLAGNYGPFTFCVHPVGIIIEL